MFDWNDQDQVGDTLWGELCESEDRIVPYPKGTEESTLLNLGDSSMKWNGEELSTLRLDMDSWPDLPSLSAALGKGYNDEKGQDILTTELMNNFDGSTDLNKARVQLDGKSEMFGNNHEDKESDSFLDCDWANIGDFDDLDRIFSNNDSIFGHEMVGNGGEFLSSSSDVINGTAQSILVPDMPLSREQPSDHESSSFHFDDLSGGNRKSEEKDDDQKKLVRSHKKAEERNKNKTQQNLNSTWSHNVCQSQQSPNPNMQTLVRTPLQTFHCRTVIQPRQVGDAENMGHLGPSNQFLLSGYGYSPCHFPAFPQLPHIHPQSNQMKPVVNCKDFPDSSKLSNSLGKPPDIPSRPLKMTPQGKIKKLRRRQQMQALLAIQQQQQQLGQQITGNDSLAPQTGSPKKQSQESITNSAVVDSTNKLSASDMSMVVDQDESQRIATSINDHSSEEDIYYELQDVLGKLDIRVRLCIRDSMFRLAQSATERQSSGERSSTNKSNKDEDEVPANQETNRPNRCKKLPGAETNTNRIDRSVAYLLFCKPVKDEMPQSHISFNTDSKMPPHTHGSTFEENPQNIGEMDVQPSV